MATRKEDIPPEGLRKRKRNVPFSDILPDLISDVRKHLVAFVGPVTDNPQPLDAEAAALVPAEGPSAANCAAVWVQANGRRAVAWNSVKKPAADKLYGIGAWDYVADASNIKHAEIKLMDADQATYMGAMFDTYIGISKPCCLPCAAIMKIEGIKTRGRHSDKNTNWDFPNIYKVDMGRMEEFLGAEVHTTMKKRNPGPTAAKPYVEVEIQMLMKLLAQQL